MSDTVQENVLVGGFFVISGYAPGPELLCYAVITGAGLGFLGWLLFKLSRWFRLCQIIAASIGENVGLGSQGLI